MLRFALIEPLFLALFDMSIPRPVTGHGNAVLWFARSRSQVDLWSDELSQYLPNHKNESEGVILLRKVEELLPEKGTEWVGGVIGIE